MTLTSRVCLPVTSALPIRVPFRVTYYLTGLQERMQQFQMVIFLDRL